VPYSFHGQINHRADKDKCLGPTKAKKIEKRLSKDKNEEKGTYEVQNEGNKHSKKSLLRKY
jgi:hypothetical protein